MTRQRPSSPARRLLDLNPSSEVRLHTAHGNGRSMYSGMQPRVSDDEDYELSRHPRTGYSGIVESGRNPYLSDVGDSNSYFGSRAGRSIPSQASFSDRSLEPSDSASNQGSNSPDDEYVPRNRHPHGYSNSHRRDAADGYHDSRRGPNSAESGSHNPRARHGHGVDRRERYQSLNSSDTSSEAPRTPRRHAINRRERYHSPNSSDSSEAPRTPRGQRGRGRSSRSNSSDDEEEEEPSTPRVYRGRGVRSRSEQARYEEDIAREDVAREFYGPGWLGNERQ